MANGKDQRSQGYPSLTARRHWGRYTAGMATEVLFALGLVAMGVALAAIAVVIWR